MKLKISVLLCFVFLLLVACSNEQTYHFKEESENWDVNYTINITGDDSQSGDITIRYIGDNETPKEINYEINGSSGSDSGNEPLNDGVLQTPGYTCSGCGVTKENAELEVTIKWDGKSDRFILKNE